ncbi:ATP-binding response regulator [Gracilimonas sp. BCB1]|uniref:ATP-binding response regulator n=1 Tax=Gracilimonas sp. BCB1 TaxID=3152362 RepID=UPI0032D92CA4
MKDFISILFIEDTEQSNQEIKNRLHQSDFSAIPFSQNGLDSLGLLLKAHKWDLIFVDLDKEDLDLSTILEILDQQEFITPLVLIGSEIKNDVLYDAMAAGVQDYVAKDNPDRLLPVVAKEIRNLRKQRKYTQTATKNQIFDRILTKSTNEIFLMDPMSLKVIYANDTLLDNLGYTEEELYGLSAKDVIAQHDLRSVFEEIAPLYRGEESSTTFQFDRKRKDGSTYPVEIHVEVTQEDTRQLLMGISFDISRQVEDAKIIEKQKQKTRELELNNKYKSQFYANVSHEMRTILNSTLLLTNILKENRYENLKDDQLEYLHTIYHSNNSVLELLNEVLDLSKIEAGKIDVRLEEVEISDICDRAERLFKPIAREKNLAFECTVNGIQNQHLKTDRLRLDQVLNNLISNAIKFTEKGQIRLEVFKSNGSQKNRTVNMIAFRVKDSGIGIPAEKQKHIFESYMQAEGSSTEKRFGGTGLGLAISKEIAHLLGGKITLESEPGKGSCFTLFLPSDSSDELAQQAEKGKLRIEIKPDIESKPVEIPEKETEKSQSTVLLVDDSSIHNMALKEFLGFSINKCITAESAEEAYKILQSEIVDCIILDMYLPDADGKEVLDKLKTDEQLKDIPVIIYSGKSLTLAEEEELLRKADAVVQKNVNSYRKLLENILEKIG